MDQRRVFTAVIRREEDLHVALCPEPGTASQGATVEEAKANLAEAVGLFLDTASPEKIEERLAAGAESGKTGLAASCCP